MALSSDLISQFSKITNDNNSEKKDTTLYGTVANIVDNGDDTKTYYVKMDGSNVETPAISTVELNKDDRVLVAIKNHTATVTGNMTNIALGKMTEGDLRSEISQTAEKITLSAEKLQGDIDTAKAEFTVEAGKIRADMTAQGDELQKLISENGNDITDLGKRMTSAETEIVAIPGKVESTIKATYIDPIEGEQEKFSKFQQTVEGFSFMGTGGTVKINGGDVNLTGAIKFSDLSDSTSVQNQINTAKSNASDALTAAANAESTADDVWTAVDGITIKSGSTTYIDGEMIYSKSIYSDAMHLGGCLTVYKTETGTSVGGYLGYDSGFNSDSGIGIRDSSNDHQVVCTNRAARISYLASNQVVCDSNGVHIDGDDGIFLGAGGDTSTVRIVSELMYPYPNNTVLLGNSNYKWSDIYCSNNTIQTSDRNEKNSIEDLPDKYIALFDKLRPRRFKLNSGTSGRYHIGYIAQEVEEAMIELGIDSLEFAGLVKDQDKDGNDVYMLRYGEFDGIYAAKIKRLENDFLAVKSENEELKARIEKLEKLLTQNT